MMRKMKKPKTALLILLLILDLGSITCLMVKASINNAASSSYFAKSALTAEASSLPSPFAVAAYIVGFVAVLGALLSLYLYNRSRKSRTVRLPSGERFWAID